MSVLANHDDARAAEVMLMLPPGFATANNRPLRLGMTEALRG